MDINDLDLNLLRVFDAIFQAKSVTLAGEQIGLSQPAVSFALNKLRVLIEDPLFIRTSRGMEPTPRAISMAAPIQHILESIKQVVLTREEFNPLLSERTFTISLVDIGEMVFLPKLLRCFRRLAPNIRIKIVSMVPLLLEDALATGEVDLAVGYYPDISKANFYQQHLFTHSFACLAARNHPYIKENLTMKQFLEASHVVVRAEGRSQEVFERYLEKKGIKRRIGLSVPHFMGILHFLPASEFVATVPYSCADAFSRFGALRKLNLPMKAPSFDLKQHWHARYQGDPANQWLRQTIYENFRNGLD